MEFNFAIKNDMLVVNEQAKCVTGNLNSYICKFEILTNSELTWLCVFKQDENAYQQVIENGKCVIPEEVLNQVGNLQVGCYAINGDIRISTNWVEFAIEDGAYTEATAPKEPTPDVWETLVMNSLPYIGENGNWYVYDKDKGEYSDSGKQAKGEAGAAGYSPVKGTDYWNDEDKAEILSQLEWRVLTEYTEEKNEDGESVANVYLSENKTEHRIGEQSNINIFIPESINDDLYETILIFSSGEKATKLSYLSNCIIWKGDDCDDNGDFVPEANKNYEISIRFVGNLRSNETNAENLTPIIVARVGAF